MPLFFWKYLINYPKIKQRKGTAPQRPCGDFSSLFFSPFLPSFLVGCRYTTRQRGFYSATEWFLAEGFDDLFSVCLHRFIAFWHSTLVVETMAKNSPKYCFVPKCSNSTIICPDKLFVTVPIDQAIRKKWFLKANRMDGVSSKTKNLHCCQDHFNVSIYYFCLHTTIWIKRALYLFRLKKIF